MFLSVNAFFHNYFLVSTPRSKFNLLTAGMVCTLNTGVSENNHTLKILASKHNANTTCHQWHSWKYRLSILNRLWLTFYDSRVTVIWAQHFQKPWSVRRTKMLLFSMRHFYILYLSWIIWNAAVTLWCLWTELLNEWLQPWVAVGHDTHNADSAGWMSLAQDILIGTFVSLTLQLSEMISVIQPDPGSEKEFYGNWW